jgi:RNA polymerase-binding transcription factor DksA
MNAFTTSQLAGIAAAIDARDRELRDELEQSGKKRYLDLAGSVHDTGDEAAATELIDMQHALIQRHLAELREIEVARGRLAAGTIDECEDCGEPIGYKRLMANPVAVRCIGCQGRFESNRPHEARSSM